MKAGEKVTGTYCGYAFSGVISSMRALTVKTDGCFEFDVSLETPINVLGLERDSLIIHARFDGSASSYTKFSDSFEAI